jgi:alkyldihydroxyacetonephosphate synthase
MTVAADQMVWNGWGDPARRRGLPRAAAALLRTDLGVSGTRTPPVPESGVSMRDSSLPAGAVQRLSAVVGAGNVRTDVGSRLLHAGGKSYPDLVRRRNGDAEAAPDAVVLPGSHDEVRAVLAVCADAEIAVVPFGGGTSVVGGVEPVRGRFGAVIALDLARLDRLISVDRVSSTAVLEPGLRGPAAEALLNAEGYTLGHFPQSYEHATIGGYAATRSAGQASTGYGRFDELVVGLRAATPVGDVELGRAPKSAAGPDLRELFVGSEGSIGVITEVTVHVRPMPEEKVYEGWSFRTFADGVAAFRRLAQEDSGVDVARLSDPDETRLSMTVADTGGAKARLGRAYLRARGHAGGCLAVVGWEGTPASVRHRRRATTTILTAAGGLRLGAGVGRAWAHGRFEGPYLRDDLMDHGVLVETLETATSWSNLDKLYAAVGSALHGAFRARGQSSVVMCHVSHLYATGASLYFTFLAPAEAGAELDQWRDAKTAACRAIVESGGTITHHHAVGTDHAAYLPAEVGEVGMTALRAVKHQLDPTGILNPGKLVT